MTDPVMFDTSVDETDVKNRVLLILGFKDPEQMAEAHFHAIEAFI